MKTGLAVGPAARAFQPRRSTASGARTSNASRCTSICSKVTSASRIKPGESSRRIGCRKEGPASQPPTAARVGGKSRIISKMRIGRRSEEHTSELQSHLNLVCRLLLEKKKKNIE